MKIGFQIPQKLLNITLFSLSQMAIKILKVFRVFNISKNPIKKNNNSIK